MVHPLNSRDPDGLLRALLDERLAPEHDARPAHECLWLGQLVPPIPSFFQKMSSAPVRRFDAPSICRKQPPGAALDISVRPIFSV